jgi:hypothetical protein
MKSSGYDSQWRAEEDKGKKKQKRNIEFNWGVEVLGNEIMKDSENNL